MPSGRAFVSHDWGEAGATHALVLSVVTKLRHYGLDVWVDETDMRGNIMDAMCKGIDESSVVLVFLTRNYLQKVQSGDERDNVRREFMYAAVTKPNAMIPIRFDEQLPAQWPGPVGMILGSQMYFDLSQPTEKKLLALVREVKPRCAHASAPNTTRKPSHVRQRVEAAMRVLGVTTSDDRHCRELIDEMCASILLPVEQELPFLDKLRKLEVELNLRQASLKEGVRMSS